MKTLIINPPGREFRPPTNFPLGLGYIAKAIKNKGHDVSVLDLNVNRKTPTQFLSNQTMKGMLREALEQKEIVFTGALTNSYTWVKWINKTIKEFNPNIKIVVGNTVGITIPEIALKHLYCDIVARGEGETISVDILDNLNNLKEVKGISFMEEGKVFHTEDREFIKDLDTIDFPAWEMFPIEKYLGFSCASSGSLRAMDVIAIRGCPFNCHYCCKFFGRNARRRSVDNILKEIMMLYERYDVRYINFSDDLFIANKEFIFEFCDKLIASGMKIKWSCSARVNTITEEILQKVKDAGCNFIGYGIESGCQKILDNMNKMQTLYQIVDAIHTMRKVGLNEAASFMIGYPGETKETIKETVEFAIKHKLPTKFFYTTAYPGTILYEQWKDRIIEKYGNEDNYLEALVDPNTKPLMNFTNMSDEEYINMKKWAEDKLRKNPKLVLYRIYKYFKATGFHGLNKAAFVRARGILIGK